jgi:eukaryotic-like serine/threonine-protein kinase
MPQSELDREQRLDELIADYLRRQSEGQAPDCSRLLKDNPDLADELREFLRDHDRFHHLATPVRDLAAQITPSDAEPEPDLQPGPFGPYEILSEIARGGMGVVFKARDPRLKRTVALKVLLAGRLASRVDRRRFRIEAESAASLTHPAIVPVHDVGEYEGRPFICMKYMEGGSLAERIHRSSKPMTPREAARTLATLARAVEHAHRRGVLHRDLKPANVLLDDDGHPHVSDFGLARHEGTGETETRPTFSGAVLGTPAYMAPEQAQGQRDSITTATDVYGLGVILYELLTGKQPFRGSMGEVLRQIVTVPPVTPRSIVPAIPRDLETICMKCLEKDSTNRYSSAATLADDLNRFLEGKPIGARRVPLLTRLWRWTTRSPWLAGLSGALIASVIVGFLLVVWQWQRAEANAHYAEGQRDQAIDARKDAEFHQRKWEEKAHEADESFRQAHSAVNRFCLEVSQELRKQSSMTPLRQSLLENALGYYQTFLKQRGNDPTLKRELAEAYHNIGWIYRTSGKLSDASAAYQRSVALHRELLAITPTDREMRVALAGSLSSLANLQDITSATKSAEEARALFEDALTEVPNNLPLRAEFASQLANQATRLIRQGHYEEAESNLNRAIQNLEQLVAENPKNDLFQRNLAHAYDQSAALMSRMGRKELSLCLSLRVDEICSKLATAHPADLNAVAKLGSSRQQLGVGLWHAGFHREGMDSLNYALKLRQQLANALPRETGHHVDLAFTLNTIGSFLFDNRQLNDALGAHQRARTVIEEVNKRDPESLELKRLVSVTYVYLAQVYEARKETGLQEEALRKAWSLQEKVLQIDPKDTEQRLLLGRILNRLGEVLWNTQRKEEAFTRLNQASAILAPLVSLPPGVRNVRPVIADNYSIRCLLEYQAHHGTASAEVARQRLRLWPPNAGELFQGACELARAASVMPEGEERARCADEAMTTLTRAVNAGYRDAGKIRSDGNLTLLHARPEFAELLRRVERH